MRSGDDLLFAQDSESLVEQFVEASVLQSRCVCVLVCVCVCVCVCVSSSAGYFNESVSARPHMPLITARGEEEEEDWNEDEC